MLFTQLEFPVFFLVVLAAAWMSPGRVTRNSILLLASYYFYAYWDVRFCGLLALSTIADYSIARFIFAAKSVAVKKSLVAASLVVNLGMLGFFKYFNFFIDSATPILEALGWNSTTLAIILPVGISFYTFQTLSYTIDVYRGKLRPTQSLLDFALFVAFFPQLVAGPIVRASELMPQLAGMPRFSKRRFYAGGQQILRGAVKKVLLADRLGEMVDVVFQGPELYSGATTWISVIAYAGQIYYDFSGYTDMAIGAAKMMGYRFPSNFRHPYLAKSMSEFWGRWHMTLSRWLRDYLYISLGGNRGSTTATYRNLMITMVLGGLWHGAAWPFVLWGVWHGAALCVQRVVRFRIPGLAAWATTMIVVLLGWVLFRSPTIGAATTIMHSMATMPAGIDWFPPLTMLAISILVAEHLAWRTKLRRAMRLPIAAWYSPIATGLMLWSLALYAPQGFRPFVYFQF